MHVVRLVALLIALASLSACTRKLCSYADEPRPSVPAQMVKLVPANTTVCVIEPAPDDRSLYFTIDFSDESKEEPAEAIARTLLADGWLKTKQDLGRNGFFEVAFAKGDRTLTAAGIKDHGRTQAAFRTGNR